MSLSPCLDCENRKTLCHKGCYKYKEYKIKLEEIKKARQEAKYHYSTHFITRRSLRLYG